MWRRTCGWKCNHIYSKLVVIGFASVYVCVCVRVCDVSDVRVCWLTPACVSLPCYCRYWIFICPTKPAAHQIDQRATHSAQSHNQIRGTHPLLNRIPAVCSLTVTGVTARVGALCWVYVRSPLCLFHIFWRCCPQKQRHDAYLMCRTNSL